MGKMAQVPAICDNCGALFLVGNISIMEGWQITFNNTMAGRCPNCGGAGQIVDGTYRISGDVLELISSHQVNKKALVKLVHLLREAQRKRFKMR